jgi:hypothetical protein
VVLIELIEVLIFWIAFVAMLLIYTNKDFKSKKNTNEFAKMAKGVVKIT